MSDKFPLDLGKGLNGGSKVSISPFVILHHTGLASRDRGDHWDWLIRFPDYFLAELGVRMQASQGDQFPGLLTFACETPPFHWSLGTQFWRLAPHRNQYLDYQGPVSGGRGQVSRAALGELEWIFLSDFQLRFRLLRLEWMGECPKDSGVDAPWLSVGPSVPGVAPNSVIRGASVKSPSGQYCLTHGACVGLWGELSTEQAGQAPPDGDALAWTSEVADPGQYWRFS